MDELSRSERAALKAIYRLTRDGDSQLADLFRRAQGASRKGGEEGKSLLRSRLGGD